MYNKILTDIYSRLTTYANANGYKCYRSRVDLVSRAEGVVINILAGACSIDHLASGFLKQKFDFTVSIINRSLSINEAPDDLIYTMIPQIYAAITSNNQGKLPDLLGEVAAVRLDGIGVPALASADMPIAMVEMLFSTTFATSINDLTKRI